MEGDFGFSWCTPWKGFLQFHGVYTMEAKNGFRGVHHGSYAENDITLSPILSTDLGTREVSRLGLRLENYVADLADNNT